MQVIGDIPATIDCRRNLAKHGLVGQVIPSSRTFSTFEVSEIVACERL